MRILLVTSMVPDPNGIGAIPKMLAAELEGLSKRNEVTLLTTYGEDPGQAEAAARLRASGLDVHAVDRRRSGSSFRRWRVRAELATTWLTRRRPWRVVCGAAGAQPLLDRLVAEHEFDVIAVEDNPMAVLHFPADIPVVFTEHEAIRAPAGQWRASRLRERPLAALRARDWRRWDRFLPSAWERFDLLQVFCEADAAAVRQRAPELAERVRINPYGMILPPATDPGREVPGTVLFTGTFAHLPNREAAIWLADEIMPAVRARRPEAKLRIVGRTPPREVLELAGPGVEIVADAASMEPHLEQAAVIVAPVRSGGGMRMKVLEAIARGKPVVTTGLGAEGFTAFPGELPFAVANEAEPFAEAIAGLLGDDAARHALGARARDFAVHHHSPAVWAERLEAVFAEAA
jgi:glycosyltransferase involved in cell wall biosynthesis